jgi:hypothetical protein
MDNFVNLVAVMQLKGKPLEHLTNEYRYGI